ncbi:MAG TPA: outer membrane protein assembly factor BamD [Candidatus Acidoferrales bacterium]|nr:outer membrane protein assembly factor BamD [Candidatus Acidoferrales bacterium]
MKRSVLILVALLLPLAACSLRQKPTGEDYYAQGQLNFASKEYKAAIENYQKLIDVFPFSPYAEDAEMKIGLAYYQQQDYAEAIGALDDFQRMHPTSPNLELVTYYIGMSYYDQMGREDQDQSKTEQALKRFQELEQRFPEGSFAQLAHDKVLVCREMLARNQMIVGNYYYKRANFRAAESRFAELMQKYPETPVAPDALFELGISLEKEGKRYSAAQAFAAVKKHFPNSAYSKKADAELKKLHEPIDTEEDPLQLVLAETGYGSDANDANTSKVVVRQRGDSSSGGASAYGEDGLPNLEPATPQPQKPDLPSKRPGSPDLMRAPAPTLPAPTGSIAGAARAQALAMTGPAVAAPTQPASYQPAPSAPAEPPALPPAAVASAAPEPSLHQLDEEKQAPPLSLSEPPTAGPATLKTVTLSSNNPPLSVILELTGPVRWDKSLENNAGGATATVVLKDVKPDAGLQAHLVFDRSIFKDCNISTSSGETTVTLNMQPIAHFAVVPLDTPPRLLVTFTPQATAEKTSLAN